MINNVVDIEDFLRSEGEDRINYLSWINEYVEISQIYKNAETFADLIYYITEKQLSIYYGMNGCNFFQLFNKEALKDIDLPVIDTLFNKLTTVLDGESFDSNLNLNKYRLRAKILYELSNLYDKKYEFYKFLFENFMDYPEAIFGCAVSNVPNIPIHAYANNSSDLLPGENLVEFIKYCYEREVYNIKNVKYSERYYNGLSRLAKLMDYFHPPVGLENIYNNFGKIAIDCMEKNEEKFKECFLGLEYFGIIVGKELPELFNKMVADGYDREYLKKIFSIMIRQYDNGEFNGDYLCKIDPEISKSFLRELSESDNYFLPHYDTFLIQSGEKQIVLNNDFVINFFEKYIDEETFQNTKEDIIENFTIAMNYSDFLKNGLAKIHPKIDNISRNFVGCIQHLMNNPFYVGGAISYIEGNPSDHIINFDDNTISRNNNFENFCIDFEKFCANEANDHFRSMLETLLANATGKDTNTINEEIKAFFKNKKIKQSDLDSFIESNNLSEDTPDVKEALRAIRAFIEIKNSGNYYTVQDFNNKHYEIDNDLAKGSITFKDLRKIPEENQIESDRHETRSRDYQDEQDNTEDTIVSTRRRPRVREDGGRYEDRRRGSVDWEW